MTLKNGLHRKHFSGNITGWGGCAPGAHPSPLAGESRTSAQPSLTAQKGAGPDHSKLEHATPKRDIELEVCPMPDPRDVGAIAAWLQELLPSNPRDPCPRSRPLTTFDVREVNARFRGRLRDQDGLYGRLAAAATAEDAVPPPPGDVGARK